MYQTNTSTRNSRWNPCAPWLAVANCSYVYFFLIVLHENSLKQLGFMFWILTGSTSPHLTFSRLLLSQAHWKGWWKIRGYTKLTGKWSLWAKGWTSRNWIWSYNQSIIKVNPSANCWIPKSKYWLMWANPMIPGWRWLNRAQMLHFRCFWCEYMHMFCHTCLSTGTLPEGCQSCTYHHTVGCLCVFVGVGAVQCLFFEQIFLHVTKVSQRRSGGSRWTLYIVICDMGTRSF